MCTKDNFISYWKGVLAATETMVLKTDKNTALDVSHIYAGPANTHHFPKKQTLALITLIFILFPWATFPKCDKGLVPEKSPS